MAKFHIKPENALYYTVDTNNHLDPSAYDEAAIEEIMKRNEEFDLENIEPMLLSRCQPCECRQAELMERAMRRQSILENPARPGAPIGIELTQEDYDQLEFGIIVKTTDLVNQDTLLIVRRCKHCGRLEFWGNIRVMMRGFADIADKVFTIEGPNADLPESDEDEADVETAEGESDDSPEYILENTETGEQIGGNDLDALLRGEGTPLEKPVDLGARPENKPEHKTIILDDHI